MARFEMFGFSRSSLSLAFLLLIVAELCCFGMAAVTPSTGRDARQVLHPLHTIDEPNFPSSLRHHLQGNVVDEIIAMITAQQYAGLEALHSAYSGQGSSKGQYFGITNVFGQGSHTDQHQCSNNITCPVCSTCTCPSKVAAPTINVVLGEQDCLTPSSSPNCSQVSIAKSGTINVMFKENQIPLSALATFQLPTFSMGILATCPSNQIKLTCSSISSALTVTTSSASVSGPVSVNEPIYDYSGNLRVSISQYPSPGSNAGSAICTWEASTST